MSIITKENPLPTSISGYSSFEEFLFREGEPISWNSVLQATSTPAVVPTGLQNVAVGTAASPTTVGKAIYIKEITAGLSAPALAQLEIAASSNGRFPNFLKQMIISSTSITVKVDRIVRGFLNNNNANIQLAVRNNLTDASVNYWGQVSASGYRITDDFNFNADKRVLFIGDSVLNGTSGPSKTSLVWAFGVKKYLTSLGYNIRVILKSVSGSTTTEHEGWRAEGYHDVDDPALIVYALGVNDAGSAVSDSVYTSNLSSFWGWAKTRYPNTKMIVCGVTPLENNTSETRAAGLRTAASQFVTSQNDSRLKYINLGNSFDRTVSSNYASSDTAGSRVHPNDISHPLIATAFNNAFASLQITL